MLILVLSFCLFTSIKSWIKVGFGISPQPQFYPALDMQIKPKHPILLVPGMLSSKLESWSVIKDSCEKYPGQYFRSTIWSKFTGLFKWFFKGKCILDIFDLDVEEGRDSPKGYKVRAGAGFQAIDYFAGGFSVWAKVIGNLGAAGYDTANMAVVPYDWRLSYEMMETRDSTFSKMKVEIEFMVKKSKEKAVILTHSLGGNFNLYFIQWVNHLDPEWMNKHIHAWISNGTPFLGSVKPMSAVITGYIQETALSFVKVAMDSAMSADARQTVMSHLRSYYSVFPIGGNKIWGNATYNPALQQPHVNSNDTVGGQVFTMFSDGKPVSTVNADDIQHAIIHKLHPNMQKFAKSLNYGSKVNATDSNSWFNPLASELPKGDYTIYCAYGIGYPTAHSYALKSKNDRYDIELKSNTLGYKQGVATVDGDITVTLTSLGYVCESAWRTKRNNPHNVKIVTREYPDQDHLSLLQENNFLRDMLNIVGGKPVSQRIHSNITAIVHQIDQK